MMQIMKLTKVLLVFFFSIFIVSCGDSGSKIKEVKLMPIQAGNEYQYIDRKGNIVINPQFSEATVFKDGLALVKTSGNDPKFGYINEDGKFEIMANYINATVFSEGISWVVNENSAPSAIDTKGEIKFTMHNAEKVKNFSNGLAAFMEINNGEERWGFLNKKGEVVINAQFADVGEFRENKCPVENADWKWGFVDKDGKLIINHQFDMALPFIGNTAIVKVGGKAGVIDKEGKYIVNPQYSDIVNDGNLFLIKQDGKFGWIDRKGKILINPQFNDALPFNGSELAPVKSGSKFGYINKEGKIIISPQFDLAFSFNGNMAMVVSSYKLGFVDKEGKYLINPQFEGASEDFAKYLLLGKTSFDSVETDFFNIEALISRIDISSPEGFKSTSKLSDVMTKFNLSESDFSKYSDQHEIISSEKISEDASMDFYIVAEPWTQKGYYDPWKFDANTSKMVYMYFIKLNGRGFGRVEAVKTAFENSLKGMKKNVSESDENASIYENDKQKVAIITEEEDEDIIGIVIGFLETKKKTNEVSSGYGDSVDEEGDPIEEKDIYQEEDEVYTINDPDGYSNLRNSPNGEILRKVYDSEKFEVIGSEAKHKKVKLKDGTIGYIHESRVVKVNSDNTQYNSSNQNNKSVLLQTTKYKIRIDNLGNGNYTYTAWPASSAMNDTPNIVIKGGKRFEDGSGGNHYYTFTNGVYKYECWINILGTDETPPANLLVYKNDDLILTQSADII